MLQATIEFLSGMKSLANRLCLISLSDKRVSQTLGKRLLALILRNQDEDFYRRLRLPEIVLHVASYSLTMKTNSLHEA